MKTQNQTGFTQMAQAKKPTFSMAITAPNTQQMISRALKNDKMAARFTSTLIGAVSASEALKACDPGTIIAAGLRGEGMGLIYGHGYYIVPYGSVATYLMSYKGYIQLAMSTGYYADIDCVEVREGELEGRSRRTGKPVINLAKYDTDEERESHKVIGYYAYFELKDERSATSIGAWTNCSSTRTATPRLSNWISITHLSMASWTPRSRANC